MSEIIYTQTQIKELENNPAVVRASERSITYSSEFKLKAVKEYGLGKKYHLKSLLNKDSI